nr:MULTISPECIES: (2Fe-2S)-binding protein [unclassified Bradyrhizobium]
MIICSCNVISDRAIRDIVTTADVAFGSPAQVYDCLGCVVQCGLCSRSVKSILEERQAKTARRTPSGQPNMVVPPAPCTQLAIS